MRKPVIAAIAGLGAAIAVAVAAIAIVTPATSPPTLPEHELVSSASDQKWVGGAARDGEKGMWRAYIRRGDDMILLGYFNEEKDARAAGRKAARDKNKEEKGENGQGGQVMDGPGCQSPLVLC